MAGPLKTIYDATWGRLFAASYEWLMADTEEAGMRERRRELVVGARGDVVEVGAGTGLNLAHYPADLASLILTEPFGPMASRLREQVAKLRPDARVIEARADSLPLPDDSADTVVCTLVLCTVDDPAGTLAELRRVLRSDGTLLFSEHVRSGDPGLARWQDRLHGPWRFVGHGCHCNRDTLAKLEGAGFAVERLSHGELEKGPAIVRPLVTGSARVAA